MRVSTSMSDEIFFLWYIWHHIFLCVCVHIGGHNNGESEGLQCMRVSTSMSDTMIKSSKWLLWNHICVCILFVCVCVYIYIPQVTENLNLSLIHGCISTQWSLMGYIRIYIHITCSCIPDHVFVSVSKYVIPCWTITFFHRYKVDDKNVELWVRVFEIMVKNRRVSMCSCDSARLLCVQVGLMRAYMS